MPLSTFPINIGAAAEQSGVSAKMIRHYEQIGLMPALKRTESGYRTYAETDVHMLRFIRHARDLGFPVKQIAELLSLWRDRRRPSAKVKALALERLAQLNTKIDELQAMKRTLEKLASSCKGNDRPQCPILDELARPDLAAVGSRALNKRTAKFGT
ncbi:MAG: Cu(I)-responsive transcriptional regulator [Casimicrobiaceae bacterium]